MKTKIIFISLLALSISSCASKTRPKLYPNEAYTKAGNEKAEADINECMKKTEDYFNTPEGKKIANSSGYGSTVGGSVGFGFGTGGSGVGLGVGVGSGRSVSAGDIKKNFTNQCLLDKGYQVLTWD